jgi:hypothetical protein
MWITFYEATRICAGRGLLAGGAAVEVDLVYYRRRSAEERTAAAASHNVKVREIHLELAAAYDQRTATLEAHNGNSTLHLVPAA